MRCVEESNVAVREELRQLFNNGKRTTLSTTSRPMYCWRSIWNSWFSLVSSLSLPLLFRSFVFFVASLLLLLLTDLISSLDWHRCSPWSIIWWNSVWTPGNSSRNTNDRFHAKHRTSAFGMTSSPLFLIAPFWLMWESSFEGVLPSFDVFSRPSSLLGRRNSFQKWPIVSLTRQARVSVAMSIGHCRHFPSLITIWPVQCHRMCRVISSIAGKSIVSPAALTRSY